MLPPHIVARGTQSRFCPRTSGYRFLEFGCLVLTGVVIGCEEASDNPEI